MENKGFLERVPFVALIAVVAACCAFNAMFVLTIRNHRGLLSSDAGEGVVCGVFLGIQLICLLSMWMKKQMAA
jgi:hypothetical protein